MKKEWKILIGTGVLLIAAIIFYAISLLNDRIPSNQISVTGNTGGNLNNDGLLQKPTERFTSPTPTTRAACIP